MFLEIFIIVVAVVLIYQLAEADINSGALWGVITAAACGASLLSSRFPLFDEQAVGGWRVGATDAQVGGLRWVSCRIGGLELGEYGQG